MPELIRRAGGEAAGPQLVRKGETPQRKPRTAADTVYGAMATLNRNVMGFDEIADGATAGIDVATGRADSLGDAWRGARKRSGHAVANLERDKPKTAAAARGMGLATEMAPALLMGGAPAAPGAARAAAQALTPLQAAMRSLATKAAPVARGAVTGALSADLAGIAGEGSIGGRMQDGANAVPLGALMGGGIGPALHLMAGTANRIGRAASPGVDRAKQTAGRILASRIPIEDQLAAVKSRLQLPFETMGRGGENLARAVANVPGPGQEIAEAALGRRMNQMPERMLASTMRDLGDDGARYHSTLEALDETRLKDSKPLYEEAYAMGPMQSRRLDDLSRRPSVRQAMGRARSLASEEDINPDELGLAHLDVMEDWANEVPPTEVGARQAEAVAARGGGQKPRRGPSLIKFIADGGGIRDRGEIVAMDGERWNRGKAFQRRLIGDADSADGWAVKAWESGYFPEFRQAPTERQLLDAIGDEMRGKARFARDADPRQADRARMVDEAEEMAYRGGTGDDLADEGAYQGRPEPGREPVFTEVPTARTWDYVKRGLDDLIEGKRDPVTGKLPRGDEQLRAWEKTRRDLRRELGIVNPTYGKALKAYSGPSQQMSAARLGRRIAAGRMDPEDIMTGRERMSDDEVEALRFGTARGLADLFRGNNPKAAMRRFATDNVAQDRLRAAFADEESFGRFMGDVRGEADAQGSFNRVLMGSRTTPLNAEIEAANEAGAGGGIGDKITEAAARSIGGEGWRTQAARMFLKSVEGMRQPSLNNPEVSKLLGEVLFGDRPADDVIAAAVSRQLISPQEAQRLLPALAEATGSEQGRGRRPAVEAGIVRDGFIFYPDGTIEPLN